RRNNATLFCDQLEFYREKQEAHAIGNVLVTSENGTVWADKAFYNFATKKGEFTNARIMANPFFGRAATISKINENYYVLADGYLTTSDYDDPEWRVRSHHIEFYPNDKAIAHNSTMYFGGVPVMYLPKYSQDLKDDRPHFSVTTGYSKKWGAFVLMAYRVYPVYGIETVYHLDYRQSKGLGSGLDFKYEPGKFGKGIVRTYYMNQHDTEVTPVTDHQRYRVEWRHSVNIDPQTTAIMQYYKVTDATFLKDYFQKEYRTDQNPAPDFLLTRTMPNLSASLRADVRVKRFESIVERLPKFNGALNNQQVGDKGLYLKGTNTAVSLVTKDASPNDNAVQTRPFGTEQESSRSF
ncbi:MAG: hypothetical protein HQL18_05570, partial [Candidatus Omnitrophica bacterium]|nr:hypothetical protein [Candidatus Omnitrophota bacterium]